MNYESFIIRRCCLSRQSALCKSVTRFLSYLHLLTMHFICLLFDAGLSSFTSHITSIYGKEKGMGGEKRGNIGWELEGNVRKGRNGE